MEVKRPFRAMRAHCLECSGGSAKCVAYCQADGKHSARCHIWPYRFGVRPETAAERYGRWAVAPGAGPGPNVPLETLPNNPADYGRAGAAVA